MKNSYFNYQMSSTRCKYSFIFPRLRAVSRGTQMATRVTAGARRERHEKRESQFFLLGLPPSFRASRGFAAELSAICDPRSSAIVWKPAFMLIFNHYPAKSEEYRRYSARLSSQHIDDKSTIFYVYWKKCWKNYHFSPRHKKLTYIAGYLLSTHDEYCARYDHI